jgi:hypothetical protein
MPTSRVTGLSSTGDIVSGRQVRARQFVALPGAAAGKPTGTGQFINAGGTLGYAQATSAQTGITTNVDLTSLSVTVTVGAGRRIRVSFAYGAANTVADNGTAVLLKEGANALMSSVVLHGNATVAGTNSGAAILTPSAGNHTYKLTAQNYVGGISSITSSATSPSWILVEDIGSA